MNCGDFSGKRAEPETFETLDDDSTSDKDDSTSVVLFDQGAKCTANRGVPSAYFKTMMANARALDDFEVPKGKTWAIKRVSVAGSFYGGQVTNSTIKWGISIFNREKVICTTFVTPPPLSSSASTSATSGIVGAITKLDLEIPCHVVGGSLNEAKEIVSEKETYYITVFPRLDYGNKGDLWRWSLSTSTNGDHFMYRDNAHIFRSLTGDKTCTKWTDGTTCGFHFDGYTDLCFQIEGSTSDTTSSDSQYLDIPNMAVKEWPGIDIGHEKLLLSEESEIRKNVSARATENYATIEVTTSKEAVVHVSIGTPAWVIPVAVVFGVLGVAVVVTLIVFVVLKTKPAETERF